MHGCRSWYFKLSGSLFLLISCISTAYVNSSKCDTCKDITRRFTEGLERTANSNFGGGNTHWEEKNLGSFTFSETRLIEILEYCCLDGTKECHHMLEENEEVLEHWWFNSYAKGQNEDLKEFLCQNSLKVCCPEGTFGPECQECPTGKDRPCSGNGICQGSGTREGSGTCACHPGYQGDICNECHTSRYFEESKNETHIVCTACHYSCQTSCLGPDAAMCNDCISGWSHIKEKGCIECDLACEGCTDSGPDNCVQCKPKHFHDGDACQECHISCATNCTDDTPKTCDSCASGWQNSDDNGCQDVDECSTDSSDCSADSFCRNTEGSFSCPKCDKTCNGCVGPSNRDCKECQVGYIRNEENECIDVDECHSVDGVCSATVERCINTLGSYSCECVDGYVRQKGKCKAKPKETKKKKKKPSADKLSTDSLGEELKKLGEPLKGVPIEDETEEMITLTGTVDESITKQQTSTDDGSKDSSEHSNSHNDL